QGAHISYGPVLDLARDPRWSRTEETMGEDAVLAGRLGAAWVRGLVDGRDYQGRSLAVVPTLKHFIAYGTSLGGQNGGSSEVGQRALLQTYLPPFREAVAAGALSVMTAYNAVDGVPCTADRWLLTDVLRRDWGFRGFVVSDLYSINVLHNTLHTTSSLEEAARQALAAGVDMDLGGLAFASLSQQMPTAEVDSAVARILRLKFQMGLFDAPYVDTLQATRIVHQPEHKSLALALARSSVVLLENRNCLPLNKGTRAYVCGPNADDVYAQLGDYTAPQPEDKVSTVVSAMRRRGCLATSIDEAEVIVAVVGGSSSRYAGTTYQATGAAAVDSSQQQNSNVDSGEGLDRSTLELPAEQLTLLDSLHQTGKPLVVVYIEGRPLLKNWAAAHADALLTAFYPGEQGGEALVEVLYGDVNPAGRLPISQPRSVGQLPVCYDRPRPQAHDYVDEAATPLYPFGFGLSYTSFAYSNLRVEGDEVSFDLKNTGSCDGEEVVQLYVSDEVSSVVLPEKRLKHFKRVALGKGESRRVHFVLSKEDFMLVDRQMNEVVEPGTFRITIGSSSADVRLETIAVR
nr:glycoside hydrolase family 3 C-terminal domain-containing protein [Bacteroidaceae bacterium]